MQVNIRPFEAQDLDSLVDLSLRAWVPVYESFAKVLGPDVFQRQYPDWRSSQRNEVQEACTGGKAHVWVADGGAKVVGFVAVVLEPEGVRAPSSCWRLTPSTRAAMSVRR